MTNTKEVRKYVKGIEGTKAEVVYKEYPAIASSPEVRVIGILRGDFYGRDDLKGVTIVLEDTGTSKKTASIPLRKIVSIKGV